MFDKYDSVNDVQWNEIGPFVKLKNKFWFKNKILINKKQKEHQQVAD